MFEGQYLTYQEYQSLGGTLQQTPFNLLEYEARNIIDLRTQNRLTDVEEIPFKVKLCEYQLINRLNGYVEETDAIAKTGNKTSENIDGYSVSYATSTQLRDIVESKHTELNDILLAGLYGVIVNGEHLIYNGVK